MIKKKRLDIMKDFDDVESIRLSFELYKACGTLKSEDYVERFDI